MPSLLNRITQLSKSSRGRSLMSQVQERIAGGGSKAKGRRSTGRRATGRRSAGRSARGRRSR